MAPEDVLAAWSEAKARIWREVDHPRGPDGRFIEKTGFGTILDKFAALGLPVFDGERFKRSVDADAPGVADLDARVGGLEPKDLIEDPEDAKAFAKTLKRTAIALDTAKMVEEHGGMGATPPVKELNRQKRAALNTIGERLGFTPEETDEASEWLDRVLTSWAIGGSLTERRREMFAASAHLRAGGRAIDAPTRGMLLQKAYTNAVWDAVHGDKPVTAVRVIGGPYGERLRAAAAVGDWELETWPLTSWAEERAKKSLVSRWAGDGDMLMARPVTRDETWLLFNGEGTFRSRGLKAPGELILDDRLTLDAGNVELEDLADTRGNESLRENFDFLRRRDPDASEGQRYAAYVAVANYHRLDLLGVKDSVKREEGYENLRMPFMSVGATGRRVYPLGRAGGERVPLDRYVGLFEAASTLEGAAHDEDAIHGVLARAGLDDVDDSRMVSDVRRAVTTAAGLDEDASTVTLRTDAEYRDSTEQKMSVREFIERQRAGELEGLVFVDADVVKDPEKVNVEELATYDRALDVIRARGLDNDTIDFAMSIDAEGSEPARKRAIMRAGWLPARATTYGKLEPGQRYYAPDGDYTPRNPDQARVFVPDDPDEVNARFAKAYDNAMDARLLVGNEDLPDAAEWEDGFSADRDLVAESYGRRRYLTADGYSASTFLDKRRLVIDWPFTSIHPDAELKVKT